MKKKNTQNADFDTNNFSCTVVVVEVDFGRRASQFFV